MEDLTTAALAPLVKEWMSLKHQMNALSAELKEKRKREKAVTGMIQKIMEQNKLGQLKTSTGAVMPRSRSVKAPITKKFLMGALTEFFKGDGETAKKCAEFLDQHRPLRTNTHLTLEAAGAGSDSS
jgi:hypothetical protein